MFSRARVAIKFLMLTILIGAMLLIMGFQADVPPATLCDALALMGTSAAVGLLLGAFIAVLLEYWPAWEGLPPKWKRPIVLLFCLVVPLVSLVSRFALCAAVIDQDTIYLAVLAGITAFTGSQFAHNFKLPSK